jgi:hypothetical protein
MDIDNMHIAVKLEVDKTSALELPSFEPEEIDFWLNNAIHKFGKTKYSGMNIKGTSFEQTQKRIDDLRTLIKVYSDTTSTTGSIDSTNGYTFQLPVDGSAIGDEDYWFTLSEEATIEVDSTETRVGIVECTMDEYRQKIDDPYSEHKLHYTLAKPLRLFINNTVELISDGNYTVNDYHLVYLRVPVTVVVTAGSQVDCDLPEHTHDEIVKLAVSMMLENIEQPRYQTYQNEVNIIE